MRFADKIRAGMHARSTKGERLGRILRVDEEGFVIEKGAFFPRDYQLYHEYVSEIRGEEVFYSLEDARMARNEFTEAERGALRKESSVEPLRSVGAREGIAGAVTGAAATVSAKASQAAAAVSARASEAKANVETRLGRTEPAGERLREHEGEVRIPLLDEEIAIQKVARESGHVRIRKEIRLEERHVTVPVRREEVVIEHVPGRQATVSPIAADAFKEQTIDLLLHEEEVRVSKRPVVREELRVRRVSHEEQREAAATLRHEEVEIEDTTPAGRKLSREQPGLAAASREASDYKKA